MSTLGQVLREARDEQRIKVQQVAERTGIPLDRIQALESDQYRALPDDVYTRGAIRNLAIFLKLDPDTMLGLYREARPAPEQRVPLSSTTTTRHLAPLSVAVSSLILVILILIALVAFHVVVL